MKFTYRYLTKWHDTDANREVRPSQILAYMQETSHHHLISAGMSLDALRDTRGLAFLLSRIAIRIYTPLYANQEIDVETWVCESRGLSFNRCFRILRGDEMIAEAFSVWALLDMHQNKLLPATAFPYNIEPDLPLGKELSNRVRLPSQDLMQQIGTRKIVYSDIDYNRHMNNTRYPDMLCDFIPDMNAHRAIGFTFSFLREAPFGESLKVLRADHPDGGFFFRTLNALDEPCLEAVVLTEKIQ